MDKSFTSYQVEERSFVSYIKREIHQLVSREKFSTVEVAEIDIIVSEMSSNLIKHVGSGEILYRVSSENEKESTFEIISIDKGKGMADTAMMMKDGVSTTKTLGQGLGAIERLSHTSQLYSIPGWGTICYALVSSKKNEEKTIRRPGLDLEVRGLCVNRPRETVCGDGYRIKRTNNEIKIFLGDGLGHGPNAKEAVDRAGDFFLACNESDSVEIIRQMHAEVRRTRGLVATVAVLNTKTGSWSICGVGNIGVRMYTGIQYKTYMSYNGTIGLNLPNTMNATSIPAERNQHLVMNSDGIQSRWDLGRYPSIFKYDNTILASALYKDYTRGNDDSSILIAKVV